MTRRLSRWSTAVVVGVLAAGLPAPDPALADEARDRQWHLRALNIAEAHRISRGEGVVVGVIDTGVNANHRDLAGNVLPGVDLTGADSRGQQDTDGHGTAMAGLIAAHGHGPGNALGALGIAPEAKILPIRDTRTKVGDSRNLPDAITEGVRRGAKVLSLSLTSGTSPELRRAVEEALAADVVVVASAGNRPADAFVGFPARYPGVVAVGATGRDGRVAPVSVTGKELVLTAPGVDIASTSHTGVYRLATGTSDATAIVAGAVALVRARYPNLSASEVVHRLTATADDRGAPGRDPEYGYGVLNIVKALTADVEPAEAPTTPGAAPTATGDATPFAADQPDVDQPTDITLSPLAYVVGGFCLLVLLAGVGALGWFLVRGRRRPRPPQPAPAGYPYPGAVVPPAAPGHHAPGAYPHPPGYGAGGHQHPPAPPLP